MEKCPSGFALKVSSNCGVKHNAYPVIPLVHPIATKNNQFNSAKYTIWMQCTFNHRVVSSLTLLPPKRFVTMHTKYG